VHNIGNFNVIDTEGFDSSERDVHEKIFEKQIALFCLALSDVLIINMWMTEIGRYEASHSHILKAVIRASDRLIAKQQRKIIFVVRDCTEDAERSILRDELNSQMMGIVKAETKKSNMRFTLEYFMMSHYYEN
jgi:protein SEY1